MSKFLIVTLCLILAGCTSPARAKDELQQIEVRVVQDGKTMAGVDCTLRNKFGSWHVVAPGSVSVHTSDDDLVVDCSKPGASGRSALAAKMTGKACGSIAGCGGIGFVINKRTGAGYAYPAEISVEIQAETQAQPGA